MTPVLEQWSNDCPFWPIAQADSFLAVPRLPTPQQVGLVVWTLIARSVTGDDRSITAASATEAIQTYLTSGEEPFASGGLRISAGDVVIDPGCCVGLDEWRDWLGALGGEVVDLGHDPDVLLEHRGPVLRIWQDKDRLRPGELPGPDELHIDTQRDALPMLLSGVHQDLLGFLGAVRQWARGIDAELADPLAAEVDRRLQISPALDI